jgi:phytoene synthase
VHGFGYGSKVTFYQRDAGALHGDIGAGSHRQTHVSGCERGGVVDAVPCHGDNLPGGAQFLDVRDFALRREDFHAIIDGMEMDVVADIRAPAEATLDLYCDRVASAVGRLSVRVFGMDQEEGIALAHHLGRALQLTNILRDLDEDASIGRLYLPAQVLLRTGITATDPASVLANPALGTVCANIVERSRRHFAHAGVVMSRNPRRQVRAPRIMSQAYLSILDSLVARGWSAPRRPIHIPRARLLWILMRHAFFL